VKERILTAWIVRSVLLALSGIAIAAASVLGPVGANGDTAARLLLLGLALYVVSRILDKR